MFRVHFRGAGETDTDQRSVGIWGKPPSTIRNDQTNRLTVLLALWDLAAATADEARAILSKQSPLSVFAMADLPSAYTTVLYIGSVSVTLASATHRFLTCDQNEGEFSGGPHSRELFISAHTRVDI